MPFLKENPKVLHGNLYTKFILLWLATLTSKMCVYGLQRFTLNNADSYITNNSQCIGLFHLVVLLKLSRTKITMLVDITCTLSKNILSRYSELLESILKKHFCQQDVPWLHMQWSKFLVTLLWLSSSYIINFLYIIHMSDTRQHSLQTQLTWLLLKVYCLWKTNSTAMISNNVLTMV